MHWLVAGLLLLGMACGAKIRLMLFVAVLAGAAVIALAAGAAEGVGAALLDAVIAVVTLQIGYAVGLALRAVVRSLRKRTPERTRGDRPVQGPLGEKRP
jgi:membrane protein implicated in regulation of membrane protease activity